VELVVSKRRDREVQGLDDGPREVGSDAPKWAARRVSINSMASRPVRAMFLAPSPPTPTTKSTPLTLKVIIGSVKILAIYDSNARTLENPTKPNVSITATLYPISIGEYCRNFLSDSNTNFSAQNAGFSEQKHIRRTPEYVQRPPTSFGKSSLNSRNWPKRVAIRFFVRHGKRIIVK